MPTTINNKCGQCKGGYFGDSCEQCTYVDDCEESAIECSNKSDSVCTKCKDGFFLNDSGVCVACGSIDHCIRTICDSADASHCAQCEGGWFAAGPECAKLEYDNNLGVWVALRSQPDNLAL